MQNICRPLRGKGALLPITATFPIPLHRRIAPILGIPFRLDACTPPQPRGYAVFPQNSGANNPEPDTAALAARAADGPVRHGAVRRKVAPTAPASDAVRARSRSPVIRIRSGGIRIIPVPSPFTYIARHVIQAKAIGNLGGDWVRGFVAIGTGPGNGGYVFATRICGSAGLGSAAPRIPIPPPWANGSRSPCG